jgi:hypothetical protein
MCILQERLLSSRWSLRCHALDAPSCGTHLLTSRQAILSFRCSGNVALQALGFKFYLFQDFRTWCILAYECGYREDDIMLKLTEACDMSSSMLPATHVVPCMEGVCIVWLALEQSTKDITRWSQRAHSSNSCMGTSRGPITLSGACVVRAAAACSQACTSDLVFIM